MGKLISRGELIRRLNVLYDTTTLQRTDEITKAFLDFRFLIMNAPTVEAKTVVHCKDCEHWGTGVAGETEHVKYCEYGKYMVGENGYCCYADMRKKVE